MRPAKKPSIYADPVLTFRAPPASLPPLATGSRGPVNARYLQVIRVPRAEAERRSTQVWNPNVGVAVSALMAHAVNRVIWQPVNGLPRTHIDENGTHHPGWRLAASGSLCSTAVSDAEGEGALVAYDFGEEKAIHSVSLVMRQVFAARAASLDVRLLNSNQDIVWRQALTDDVGQNEWVKYSVTM